MSDPTALADVVRRGLLATPKSLPPYLFYDAEGSRLFEQITTLAEYYPTRTERAIFERYRAAIVSAAQTGPTRAPTVFELGAGTSTKTQILLEELARGGAPVVYVPCDLSPTALAEGQARLRVELPGVDVRPLVAPHGVALASARRVEGPLVVLFVGSSLGNYEDTDAVALLAEVAASLGDRGALVLGVDAPKPLEVLVPAYDDAAGVTAAFNLNLLVRLNRELGAHFDVARFRHFARWNEAASAIEMHLVSLVPQRVAIDALDLVIDFTAGETIHTESSHKYDDARVDALFRAAGLARVETFRDERRWFSVHVARRR